MSLTSIQFPAVVALEIKKNDKCFLTLSKMKTKNNCESVKVIMRIFI